MALVHGSNNYVELCALKLMLCFAREKNCTHLQMFGDSIIVINWINKVQLCHSVFLNSVMAETQRLMEELDSFSCRHVYREQNTTTDQLSNLGLTLPLGKWKITKQINKFSHEYYHRPFIEGLEQNI